MNGKFNLSDEQIREVALTLKNAFEEGTSGWSPELLKEVRKMTKSPFFKEENEPAISSMIDFFGDEEKKEALNAWSELYHDGKGFGKISKWAVGLLVASGVSIVTIKNGSDIVKAILK